MNKKYYCASCKIDLEKNANVKWYPFRGSVSDLATDIVGILKEDQINEFLEQFMKKRKEGRTIEYYERDCI